MVTDINASRPQGLPKGCQPEGRIRVQGLEVESQKGTRTDSSSIWSPAVYSKISISTAGWLRRWRRRYIRRTVRPGPLSANPMSIRLWGVHLGLIVPVRVGVFCPHEENSSSLPAALRSFVLQSYGSAQILYKDLSLLKRPLEGPPDKTLLRYQAHVRRCVEPFHNGLVSMPLHFQGRGGALEQVHEPVGVRESLSLYSVDLLPKTYERES